MSTLDGTSLHNLGVIQKMGEAFNRKDLDAIMELFASDAVYEDYQGSAPAGDRYFGAAAIRGIFAAQFAGTPGYWFEDHIPLVSDRWGALEYTIVVPGDTTRRAKLCDFFEFRDGKVVRKSTWLKQVRSTG